MTMQGVKGREAPKAVRSQMDTMLFTRAEIEQFQVPVFQRPIRINAKVLALVEELKESGGVIPGVLTLGKVGPTSKTIYIVDGQHRIEAFKLSELPECMADVRMVTFDNLADMSSEFVDLNSRLVNMRPDDILRSLAQSMQPLRRITNGCEFVTYGHVRRGTGTSALVSMSALLRAWYMSNPETPSTNAPNATILASSIDNNEADKIIVFMNAARSAWGTDPENYRLWSVLNMTISMWLWRRLVLEKDRGGSGANISRGAGSKAIVLTPEQFRKCMMSVSADRSYVDWLVGRNMNERDRSPCYVRLKAIFQKRLQAEGFKKVLMPAPSWASR